EYSEKHQKQNDTVTAIHSVAELCHKRSLIILFTDFLDNPSKTDELFHALQHLKHNKHEVIVFHVVDKKTEIEFNFENRPYTLVDMETGEKMKVQPAELKANYQEAINRHFNELKMRMMNHKIDFVQVDINKGYDAVLLQYLLKRQKMN
ncbi:MAG TPA: DUF58 domain-containing protein, partial [Taishania sp.]|nr:DUF58 domain-containing protein [Taishania sp.]